MCVRKLNDTFIFQSLNGNGSVVMAILRSHFSRREGTGSEEGRAAKESGTMASRLSANQFNRTLTPHISHTHPTLMNNV